MLVIGNFAAFIYTNDTRSSTSGNFYVKSSRLELRRRSFSGQFGVKRGGIRYYMSC